MTPRHAAPHPSPRYKWWVVFMLWFVCFFNYADRQAIFAVFPTLRAEFGFDTVELGLIGSAFMWVYAGAAPAARARPARTSRAANRGSARAGSRGG